MRNIPRRGEALLRVERGQIDGVRIDATPHQTAGQVVVREIVIEIPERPIRSELRQPTEEERHNREDTCDLNFLHRSDLVVSDTLGKRGKDLLSQRVNVLVNVNVNVPEKKKPLCSSTFTLTSTSTFTWAVAE